MQMPMNNQTKSELAQEIEATFPIVEMPAAHEIPFKTLDSTEAAYLTAELDQFRGKLLDGDAIRLIHQELSHLSAKAWQWLLPHYLRFCLTPEAAYSRMETEFLIYNLGPDLPFQRDTLQRLSLLTTAQIQCLIDFLYWCLNTEPWREHFPNDIQKAIGFLQANFPTQRFD
jgi:hypothetical protein